MYISRTFVGKTMGKYRCMFYLLLEDYIDEQQLIEQHLNFRLERFARNLAGLGAVVRPFPGDIESTNVDVRNKNWPPDDQQVLEQHTPCLLMINVDFDKFDPRADDYLLLYYGERHKYLKTADEFADALDRLAEAIAQSNQDVFKAAHTLTHELRLSEELSGLVEAKPGIAGFTVDLKKGATFIRKLYERMAA